MKKISIAAVAIVMSLILMGGGFGLGFWIGGIDNDDNKEDNGGPTETVSSLGVVWWRNVTPQTLQGIDVDECDFTLLDFAQKNGVTEIYLNQNVFTWVNLPTESNPNASFGPNGRINAVYPTRTFIRQASNRGIKVYLLLGNNGSWLVNEAGRATFDHHMIGFRTYQNMVEEDQRFVGVQMNVEPHQQGATADEPFHANRNLWLQRKVDFVTYATGEYGDDFTFDWIIPFWWRNPDYDLVTYRGEENVLAYRAIMRESNRISVMSFRDSAEAMANIAIEVLEYAQELGIEVILMGTIIYSGGQSNVQFLENGNEEMLEQLGLLQNVVNGKFNNVKVTPSIHHIVTWYQWA